MPLPSVRLLVLVSSVALVGVAAFACGDSEEGGSSPGGTSDATVDAGPGGQGPDAGGQPPDGGSTTPPVSCPNGTEELVLTASADTTMTASCNGAVCYGNIDAVQVGRQNADSSNATRGLVRFTVNAAQAGSVFGAGVVSAKLVLHAYPTCTQCGSGSPPRAGVLRAHAMRSDWVEFAAGASCGVDQCRRTSGANALGWGPDAPASNATAIAPGVDYAETATTADFATGATSAEVPVTAAQLLAFAPPAKDAVSFLLEDGATGRFMFASREAPADAGASAAELRVLHCK